MFSTRSRRRLIVVGAGVLSGSLLLAGPAAAACQLTIDSYDDGSANTTLDMDYSDDYASKTLNSPSAPGRFTSGMTVYLAGTGYGGCGNYQLYVNGSATHTFNTCAVGWQQQTITGIVAGTTSLTIRVADIDGNWNTGILWSIDTNFNGSHTSAHANGVYTTGELMWRVGAVCT